MSEAYLYDVFVSYSAKDLDRVLPIAVGLREAGLKVWFDQWVVEPGTAIRSKVIQGVLASCRVLFCITQASLDSEWVEFERDVVLNEHPNNRDGRLIPLLLEDCALPKGLSHLEVIDGSRGTAATMDRIRRALRRDVVAEPSTSATNPSQLPLIHNIPSRPTRVFCGREDVLTALYEQFASGHKVALTQVIQGLGGLGKTQIALEYAYRYGARYQVIWWLRAEFPEIARQDLAALASRLRLNDDKTPDASARDWLDRNRGWLLIFDNAEAPKSIQHLLPRLDPGHVLITSRYGRWNQIATRVAVDFWARSESIEYLGLRTGQTDPAAKDALAELLGDFPLGLDQAASFILEAGISVSRYIELFEENPPKMLNSGDRSEGYENTVATTWNLAFKRVRAEDRGAAELLEILAHCKADRVPRALFLRRLGALPSPLRTNVDFHHAIARLAAYSLVTVNGDELFMHRLVRQITRDQQTDALSAIYQKIRDKLYQRQASYDLLSERLDAADDDKNRLANMLLDDTAALAQACASITACGISLDRYIQALEAMDGSESVFPISRTTNVAIDFLRVRNHVTDLLGILAHSDLESTSIRQLRRPDLLPVSLRSEAAMNDALDLASKHGLLSLAQDDRFSMTLRTRTAIKRNKRIQAGAVDYRRRAIALFGSPDDCGEYPDYHLRLEGIYCSIQEREVLHGIDCVIPYHAVTAIIGPSGAGLSTLLRVMGGPYFVRDLRVEGSVTNHEHVGRGIALAASDPFIEHESIRAGFDFRLKIAAAIAERASSRRRRDEAIERALHRLSLWDFYKDRLHKPASSLSNEHAGLLKIAQAICTDPDLLLVDSDVLPRGSINEDNLINAFLELKNYCTIVIAAHNLPFVAKVSDRTAFVFLGKLIEYDDTRTIFMTPKHKMTEDFITGRFG